MSKLLSEALRGGHLNGHTVVKSLLLDPRHMTAPFEFGPNVSGYHGRFV